MPELPPSDVHDLDKKYTACVAEVLQKQCKRILSSLMDSRFGFVFNAPVDCSKYTTYRDKVDVPMDFGTIKAHLEGGKYVSVDEFKADILLVFDNARAFNPPGSDVFVMAESLQVRSCCATFV